MQRHVTWIFPGSIINYGVLRTQQQKYQKSSHGRQQRWQQKLITATAAMLMLASLLCVMDKTYVFHPDFAVPVPQLEPCFIEAKG